MAYTQPQAWYIHSGNGSTTGYYAVPQWAASTSYTAGQLIRPLTAPAVGNERVYVCYTAGTSGSSEPTWTFTKGVIVGSLGAFFMECTGEPGVNGDLTNCLLWTASSTPAQGRVIYDPTSNACHICYQSGAGLASKPTFSTTLGGNTNDNSAAWKNIGLFSAWAAPHARALSAIAANWGAAGNDFYIADNSAETSTVSLVLSFGSVTAPSRVMSIDHTASLPANAAALKAGASITSNFASSTAIWLMGATQIETYWYGISFIATGAQSGTGTQIIIGASTNNFGRFEACSFQLGTGSGTTTNITIGSGSQNGSVIEFVNCTFGFTNVGQNIIWASISHHWRNTPDPCFTGTIPTIPFRAIDTNLGSSLFEGIDFTSVGSNTLISNTFSFGFLTFKNCKMHTGPLMQAVALAHATTQVDLVNCDSGANYWRNERHSLFGDLTTNVLAVRTGGASDGTTAVSHYIVASAFAKYAKPFPCLPLIIWNDLVGSPRTVTVYAAALVVVPVQNNQFWIDVEYMGSTTTPIASVVSSGLATPLTTPANYTADTTSAWDSAVPLRQNSHVYAVNDLIKVASNPGRVFVCTIAGTSGTSEPGGYATAVDGTLVGDAAIAFRALSRFSASVTFTAQQKGYITIYPKMGIQIIMFLDPEPALS